VTFVDYLSARGLQAACRGEVSPDEVALDIRAVSAHVQSLPYARPGAVGVVGWSLGGAGVLASLSQSGKDIQPPFRVAATFHPVCTALQPWKTNVPVLMLRAGLDDIAPPAACDRLARSVGFELPIEVRTYPEARHSFDVSDLPAIMPSRASAGKTAGYNAAAAQQAWSEVLERFNRHLE
jgi:dienelactone hydrolase